MQDRFDTVVDGVVAAEEHLKGKPAPDTFLAAARRLGVEPREASSTRTRWPGCRPGAPGASAA